MKLFMAIKKTYINFDIPVETPQFVGPKDVVMLRIETLNKNLSENEILRSNKYIAKEIKYIEN